METIRPARPEELTLLPEIERASGEAFRDIGMPEIADDTVTPVEVLAEHPVWVAAVDDEPVAFVVAMVIDGCVHVDQISVHPDHARRGIGARLLDHVDAWAARQGYPALTLTTFRDVPWNGPYYRRLGFRVLAADEITPGLAAVRAGEVARGLDPTARVSMRREVTARWSRPPAARTAARRSPPGTRRTR
jgi:GNAT superfamily N-acetyltransferase